ncbi:MAG: hypothetical protein BM558_02155 [Roseobacter sp. MedPE-SW]|nr:MAG: hypothetical protein BM558_02155 [Roseobacter sp. MedPE-SW]
MIWTSAVTGAFLALISTSAALIFLALPIWTFLLIYPTAAGLFTAVIFAILFLRSLPRSEGQEVCQTDDQYYQNSLVSSLATVCTRDSSPYKK